MNRRGFIKNLGMATTALGLSSCGHTPIWETEKQKPNIVVFFIDDLGYADVGYHGCKDVPTPNIDSIAKKGAQFSAAYVTAPVCSPSRAGLLSGQYQQRFGAEDNPGPFRRHKDTKVGIPKTIRTMGEHMQAAGYKTAYIGKQHSGRTPENNPTKRGFDLFFGFDNGSHFYYSPDNKKRSLKRNTTVLDGEPDYLTDAFGREAVRFIDQNKDNPFVLYIPFNAVHTPMQAPQNLIDKFKHIKEEKRRILAAMLTSVDQNIGKVLAQLRKHGLEENTLVICTSDNGGAREKSNYSYNQPCRDQKGTLYDGGIRVPFCMQWKNIIAPEQKFDFPIITLDILPTMLASAGQTIDPKWKLDGINLLPYVMGQAAKPKERYLYWRWLFAWGIRDSQWKLVKPWGKDKPELYNIAADIGETRNLISKEPAIAKRLKNAYDQWSETLMEPQWGWQPMCGDYKVELK